MSADRATRLQGLEGLGRRESMRIGDPISPWQKRGQTQEQFLQHVSPVLSRALIDINENNVNSLVENHKEVLTQLAKVVELAGYLHTRKETDKLKGLFNLIGREVKDEQHSIHRELDTSRSSPSSED